MKRTIVLLVVAALLAAALAAPATAQEEDQYIQIKIENFVSLMHKFDLYVVWVGDYANGTSVCLSKVITVISGNTCFTAEQVNGGEIRFETTEFVGAFFNALLLENYITPACGNALCEQGENREVCPSDCP